MSDTEEKPKEEEPRKEEDKDGACGRRSFGNREQPRDALAHAAMPCCAAQAQAQAAHHSMLTVPEPSRPDI